MRGRFLIFGRAGICAVMLASMLAVSGCSGKNPHFDPDKAHHTPTGFRNNYPHSHPSRLDLLRWSIQRRLAGVPRPPRREIATVRADLDFIQANAHETAVTWIGHATVLVQMGGLNILTDPTWMICRASTWCSSPTAITTIWIWNQCDPWQPGIPRRFFSYRWGSGNGSSATCQCLPEARDKRFGCWRWTGGMSTI